MAETETVDAPAGTTSDLGAAPPDTTWQAAIPPDYAKDKAWEPLKSKGLPDVLKGYAEAQKLVSSSVRLPPANGTPADVAKWKAENGTKLGGLFPSAPAAPTDYKFDRPD